MEKDEYLNVYSKDIIYEKDDNGKYFWDEREHNYHYTFCFSGEKHSLRNAYTFAKDEPDNKESIILIFEYLKDEYKNSAPDTASIIELFINYIKSLDSLDELRVTLEY